MDIFQLVAGSGELTTKRGKRTKLAYKYAQRKKPKQIEHRFIVGLPKFVTGPPNNQRSNRVHKSSAENHASVILLVRNRGITSLRDESSNHSNLRKFRTWNLKIIKPSSSR